MLPVFARSWQLIRSPTLWGRVRNAFLAAMYRGRRIVYSTTRRRARRSKDGSREYDGLDRTMVDVAALKTYVALRPRPIDHAREPLEQVECVVRPSRRFGV